MAANLPEISLNCKNEDDAPTIVHVQVFRESRN